eukprot:1584031-Amphidinium_carterae.1
MYCTDYAMWLSIASGVLRDAEMCHHGNSGCICGKIAGTTFVAAVPLESKPQLLRALVFSNPHACSIVRSCGGILEDSAMRGSTVAFVTLTSCVLACMLCRECHSHIVVGFPMQLFTQPSHVRMSATAQTSSSLSVVSGWSEGFVSM